MSKAKNPSPDRRRFRLSPADSGRHAVRGPRNRSHRHCQRSFCRRGADQRSRCPTSSRWISKCPAWTDSLLAEDHAPAPDPGRHLFHSGRRQELRARSMPWNTGRWISSPSRALGTKQFLEESSRHPRAARSRQAASARIRPRPSSTVEPKLNGGCRAVPRPRRHARNHRESSGHRRLNRRHRGAARVSGGPSPGRPRDGHCAAHAGGVHASLCQPPRRPVPDFGQGSRGPTTP